MTHDLNHHRTACWEDRWDLWKAFVQVSPHMFIFILSPQPLWPTTQISRLLCYARAVVATASKPQFLHRHLRVESQGYFMVRVRREAAIFPVQQAMAPNSLTEVQHLTRFIEKVDSELPSSLMMLIRQLLKMKNGCELAKNRRNTIFQLLLQVNKAKW